MNSVPIKTLCFFPCWPWVEIVENGDFAPFINLKEHCVGMGNEYFKQANNPPKVIMEKFGIGVSRWVLIF